MQILIDNKSGAPIYEQIYTQLKEQIISGALTEDQPLPSIRGLAKDLRISVITTKRAYEELERDGFITTMTGKGSFVAKKNLEFIKEEQMRTIEQLLAQAVDTARQSGITAEELQELIAILYTE